MLAISSGVCEHGDGAVEPVTRQSGAKFQKPQLLSIRREDLWRCRLHSRQSLTKLAQFFRRFSYAPPMLSPRRCSPRALLQLVRQAHLLRTMKAIANQRLVD